MGNLSGLERHWRKLAEEREREKAYIKEHYGKKSNVNIMSEFGISQSAFYRIVKELNLPKLKHTLRPIAVKRPINQDVYYIKTGLAGCIFDMPKPPKLEKYGVQGQPTNEIHGHII